MQNSAILQRAGSTFAGDRGWKRKRVQAESTQLRRSIFKFYEGWVCCQKKSAERGQKKITEVEEILLRQIGMLYGIPIP